MSEFFQFDYLYVIITVIKIVAFILILFLFTAYLTLAERKIIAFMQLRVGPSVVGPFGLLQPISDAIKLLFKEIIIPSEAKLFLFLAAPIISMFLALIGWAVIPFGTFIFTDTNLGLLYLIAISSLNVYGILIAGWSSNSKYAFLGAMRSSAQMISYELTMAMCILSVVVISNSVNLSEIVVTLQNIPWYFDLMLIPIGILFFICTLAETNRHPFDLPEAEGELVAGYHVEYSSMSFAMFFLGEYANMALMGGLTSTLFLGGWFPPFGITFLEFIPGFIWMILKICFCLFCFIWIRAAIPRYRYDQLIFLGWKVFLPLIFILFIVISVVRFVTM